MTQIQMTKHPIPNFFINYDLFQLKKCDCRHVLLICINSFGVGFNPYNKLYIFDKDIQEYQR